MPAPRKPQVKLASGALIGCAVHASAAQPGDKVTLGIRPEHLVVGGTHNPLETVVTFVQSLGSSTHA